MAGDAADLEDSGASGQGIWEGAAGILPAEWARYHEPAPSWRFTRLCRQDAGSTFAIPPCLPWPGSGIY